jgi:hypothetical protein
MVGIKIGTNLSAVARSKGLSDLFAAGEDGFLFNGFVDKSRLFTGVTASGSNIATDGETLAFSFESSLWAGKPLSQISAEATQLLLDPGFDDAAQWLVTQAAVAGSLATVTSPTGTLAFVKQNVAGLIVGGFYEFQVVVDSVTRGSPLLGFSGGSAAVTDPGVGPAKGYLPATLTTAGWEFKRNPAVDTLFAASSGSFKRIKGNHFNQGTVANRPTWRGGDRPYLEFDGVNDSLLTPKWKPGPAGTVAAAFRHNAVATGTAFAGGIATGNKRLRLSLSATGRPELAYNDQFQNFGLPSSLGQDVVLVATYDAAGADFYVNGVMVGNIAIAPNMDGTGDITSLGAIAGGASNFLSGNLYGAMAMSRRASVSEVALINNSLRSRIP